MTAYNNNNECPLYPQESLIFIMIKVKIVYKCICTLRGSSKSFKSNIKKIHNNYSYKGRCP